MNNSFVTAVGFDYLDENTYFDLIDFSASRVLKGKEKGIVIPVKLGFPMAVAEAGIQLGIPVMLVFDESRDDITGWSPFWVSRYLHVFENSASKKIVKFPKGWILNYLSEEGGLVYSMWDGSKGEDALFIRSAERVNVDVINFFNDFTGG